MNAIAAPAPRVAAPAAPERTPSSWFWILNSAGWAGYFAFSFLMALAHGKPADYCIVPVVVTVAGFLATSGLRIVLRALMPLSAPRFFAAALVPVFATATLIGVAYGLALDLWGCTDCRPRTGLGYVAYMGSFIWVVLAWTGLYWGTKTWQQLQRETQSALAAHAMAHQAQLKMLRYQLNPHFLFNTLNAISTLVLDGDHATANRMVTSLSAFLRHSLDADPMQRVTLKQELDALHLYLGIEKVRFADRLTLRTEVEPDAYRALMPSLLLQPLIENAIKYGVSKRVEGGTIEVHARRDGDMLEIAIRDDGPGSPHFESGELPPGNGVGLRNARERLRVLFGDRQSFVARNRRPHGAEIVLRLPFETTAGTRE